MWAYKENNVCLYILRTAAIAITNPRPVGGATAVAYSMTSGGYEYRLLSDGHDYAPQIRRAVYASEVEDALALIESGPCGEQPRPAMRAVERERIRVKRRSHVPARDYLLSAAVGTAK